MFGAKNAFIGNQVRMNVTSGNIAFCTISALARIRSVPTDTGKKVLTDEYMVYDCEMSILWNGKNG